MQLKHHHHHGKREVKSFDDFVKQLEAFLQLSYAPRKNKLKSIKIVISVYFLTIFLAASANWNRFFAITEYV